MTRLSVSRSSKRVGSVAAQAAGVDAAPSPGRAVFAVETVLMREEASVALVDGHRPRRGASFQITGRSRGARVVSRLAPSSSTTMFSSCTIISPSP